MSVERIEPAVPARHDAREGGGTVAWSLLWALSAKVVENRGWRGLRDRIRFVLKARSVQDALTPFLAAGGSPSLQRAMQLRPEMAGAVVWPYICAHWDARRRLAGIVEHFRAIDALGAPLDFPMDQSWTVADLSDLQAGLRLVLDQPRWFMREGQLVLNLFGGDVRIYSIAFSLAMESDGLVAYVGAIQGGNTEGVMAEYKDMTKTLHGMRPRDFLVELMRTLLRHLGVRRIEAVCDASRQHRSSYFGTAKSETLSLNYDEIWSERGGERGPGDFFLLALQAPLKPLEEIASKKRAMYRRRYEMLEDLDARVAQALGRGGA